MDQLPGRSDNAIKNRYHIISKNNYAEHNRITARKAHEAECEHSKQARPESNEAKMKRFCSARDALDQKIALLLAEQAESDIHIDGLCEHPPSEMEKTELCTQSHHSSYDQDSDDISSRGPLHYSQEMELDLRSMLAGCWDADDAAAYTTESAECTTLVHHYSAPDLETNCTLSSTSAVHNSAEYFNPTMVSHSPTQLVGGVG